MIHLNAGMTTMTTLSHQRIAAPTVASQSQPRFLWFLTLAYSMVLVFANLFDPRLVSIFGLITDAGTLIFPLTFLLSDLITEVYGYKQARRAIWVGFLFNILFILYGQLVIHMPNPSYPTHNEAFNVLFTLDTRVILASLVSYLCSEPLNSYVLAKLKIKTKGKHMSLRFVASTVVASGFDSFVFGITAFYGVIGNNSNDLLTLILTMWLIKVFIEICGLPLSLKCANALKSAEQLDIYDSNTNFTIFALDYRYGAQQNKFGNKLAETAKI